MCFRSSLNACRSSSLAKYLFDRRPLGDRVDHAADQLLDAALALGRADLAAEILRDDDVGGLLRPDFGISTSRCSNTTSPRSLPITRGAQLPFDLVERIDARLGEEARECQARRRGPPSWRARLRLALDRNGDAAVHCSRPSAGRHRRSGRQRGPSCSHSHRSGDRRRTPGHALPWGGRHLLWIWRRPVTRSWGVLAETRSRYGRQICARPAGLSSV